MWTRTPRLLTLCALWAAGASGCTWTSDTPAAARLLVGETRALGEGSVRSWLALGKDGTPAGLGVTFTERAVSGIPAGAEHTVTLALPSHAGVAPFDHIEIGWRPRGGAPNGIFDRPRFDLLFYLIPRQEREAITDPERSTRPPAPSWIPASYVPTPDLIPHVGARWIDPTAPEFNGNPFEHGFAYGFYDGQLVFLEPRVTRAFLESKPHLTTQLRLPIRYARAGYYPTRYSVRYDARAREYTVALEGLVRRP